MSLPYPSPHCISKGELVIGDTLGTPLSGSSGITNKPHKEIQANVDYLNTQVETNKNYFFKSNYGTATGINTYLATILGLELYVTGLTVTIKFINANTNTEPTLNLNSLGAKTIKRNTTSLFVGDIKAGGTYKLVYDGTDFIIQNPSLFGTNEIPDESVTTAKLSTSGVTAGTYGNSLNVPKVTVDNKGRITGVSLTSQSSYILAAPAGGSASRVVTLSAGTWQLVFDTRAYYQDGGNHDFYCTQIATVSGVSATTSIHFMRSGGSGYGRIIHGSDIATNTLVLSADTEVTMTINTPSPGLATVSGSKLIAERIS